MSVTSAGTCQRGRPIDGSGGGRVSIMGTRAIDAYTLLTDKNCPFKVTALKPSQRARTLLG